MLIASWYLPMRGLRPFRRRLAVMISTSLLLDSGFQVFLYHAVVPCLPYRNGSHDLLGISWQKQLNQMLFYIRPDDDLMLYCQKARKFVSLLNDCMRATLWMLSQQKPPLKAGVGKIILNFACYLMYSFNTPFLLGWRSLRRALASIWRIRSRVTSKICPISSNVFMRPSSRP